MSDHNKSEGYTIGELIVRLGKLPPTFKVNMAIVSEDRMFKMDGKATDIVVVKESKTVFLYTAGGDVSMPPPQPPKK